jgi:hypothetical protein
VEEAVEEEEEAEEEAVEEEDEAEEEAVEEAVEAAGAMTTTTWLETVTIAVLWEPCPNSSTAIPPTPTNSWTA